MTIARRGSGPGTGGGVGRAGRQVRPPHRPPRLSTPEGV